MPAWLPVGTRLELAGAMPGWPPVTLRGAGLLLAPARLDDFTVSPPPALQAAFLRDFCATETTSKTKTYQS